MATLYAVHGDTGTYIEVDCLNADGSTPDFTGATLQVEVFRLPNTLVLDGTPTSPSSGKLRYTFVAGNWDTIPNRTQHYAVTWHSTSGGVRRSYPGEGYDTLVVTADPQGVPSDVSEVAYATLAYASATFALDSEFDTHRGATIASVHELTAALDTARDLYQWTPNESGVAAFSAGISAGLTNEGQRDHVWYMGYNTAAGTDNTSEPIVRYVIESNWKTGGVNIVEHYWEFFNIARDVTVRPVFVNHTRIAGVTAVSLRGHNGNAGGTGFVDIGVKNGAGTDIPVLKVLGGGVQVVPAVAVTWLTAGAKTYLSGLNAASSAFLTVLQQYASDDIGLGGTGAVRVAGAAAKVGFYGTDPITKPSGVAVSAAGIHAALVSLGLIAA